MVYDRSCARTVPHVPEQYYMCQNSTARAKTVPARGNTLHGAHLFVLEALAFVVSHLERQLHRLIQVVHEHHCDGGGSAHALLEEEEEEDGDDDERMRDGG